MGGGGGAVVVADLSSDGRFVALDVFVAFSCCFGHLVSLCYKKCMREGGGADLRHFRQVGA